MKIVHTPNPVLVTPAKPVVKFDAHLQKTIEEMADALARADNPKGIGLAAPQVGLNLQIFIIKLKENATLHIFINPKMVWNSPQYLERKNNFFEGCLSIPTIWAPVKRFAQVTLEYQDILGKAHKQTFDGMMATTIQHEMDHLMGCLFPARVMEQKGKLYKLVEKENGKKEFEELILT